MELIVIIFVTILIVAVPIAFQQANEKEKEKLKLKNELTKKYSLSDSYCEFDDAGKRMVGINFSEKFLIVQIEKKLSKINFENIIECELRTNGGSVSKTNRGSQAVGAAVGALALGPAGLLIGGLSGSKQTIEKVQTIELVLTVNRKLDPIIKIPFFKSLSKKGSDPSKNKLFLKPAIENAEKWNGHMINIMNSSAKYSNNSSSKADSSISQQVRELWDLYEAGALSQEEYETQKSKLLR